MWTFSSGFDPLWREGISTRVWRILRTVEKEDLPDTAHSEIRNVGTTIHSTSVLSDKRICKSGSHMFASFHQRLCGRFAR